MLVVEGPGSWPDPRDSQGWAPPRGFCHLDLLVELRPQGLPDLLRYVRLSRAVLFLLGLPNVRLLQLRRAEVRSLGGQASGEAGVEEEVVRVQGLALVAELVREIEEEGERDRDGRPVAGVAKILSQDPFKPPSRTTKKSPRRRFHLKGQKARDDLWDELTTTAPAFCPHRAAPAGPRAPRRHLDGSHQLRRKR
jgi:hypothetical protein